MKPVFKKTLRPVVRKETSIEVHLNGLTTELDDADGKIFDLIELMDGTRTTKQLALSLNITEDDIHSAVLALNDLGFIEDSAVPPTYSETELERYQANLNYFSGYASLETSKYSFQDRLRNSKVAVLGMGGGSLAAAYLAGLGVGEIVGVDFDTVERTNLNRQFLYNENDIGNLKSRAAEQKLRLINPDITVTIHNKEITGYKELLPLIKGANAVITMMDQPAIQAFRWVNAACYILGIPFYMGGFNNQSIMWERRVPSHQDPCYDCKLLDSLESDPDNAYRLTASYGKTFSQVNTGFAPNLSILTGLFISDAVKMITGIAPISKPQIHVDTSTMEISQTDYPFDSKAYCPTCSEKRQELADLDELIRMAKTREVSI